LGVRDQPGRPLAETLSDYLRPRQLLLILDNCEHLIDACAKLAGTLLGTCPDLKVLATSREPLGFTGETGWLVPSLSVPDLHHPQTPGGLDDRLELRAAQPGGAGSFPEAICVRGRIYVRSR
jgi:serine/threonine-protein kinase PknK